MKPFRAWVAWHPEHGAREIGPFASLVEAKLSGIPLHLSMMTDAGGIEAERVVSLMKQDGWRIIEVECVPVEGKKDE